MSEDNTEDTAEQYTLINNQTGEETTEIAFSEEEAIHSAAMQWCVAPNHVEAMEDMF